MTAEPVERAFVSIEDYLAGEVSALCKHEYLGGVVYAMAGGSNAHSAIAANVLGSLHAQLRGKRCRPFNSDAKVRIQLPTHTRFYYPDVMIVCQPGPPEAQFQDAPVVIVEVASESTHRIDQQEKREAYLQIATLQSYILLEQERPVASVWRRTDQGFVTERHEGLAAIIALPSIDGRLVLADAYEGVDLHSGVSKEAS